MVCLQIQWHAVNIFLHFHMEDYFKENDEYFLV